MVIWIALSCRRSKDQDRFACSRTASRPRKNLVVHASLRCPQWNPIRAALEQLFSQLHPSPGLPPLPGLPDPAAKISRGPREVSQVGQKTPTLSAASWSSVFLQPTDSTPGFAVHRRGKQEAESLPQTYAHICSSQKLRLALLPFNRHVYLYFCLGKAVNTEAGESGRMPSGAK